MGWFTRVEYSYVPKTTIEARNRLNATDVNVGDRVELGSINIMTGLFFRW